MTPSRQATAGRPANRPAIYAAAAGRFSPPTPVGGQGTPTASGQANELNPGRRGPPAGDPGVVNLRAPECIYIPPRLVQ